MPLITWKEFFSVPRVSTLIIHLWDLDPQFSGYTESDYFGGQSQVNIWERWIEPMFYQMLMCVYVRVCVCALSHIRLSAATWTVAHQAPLSMGLSRQGYWSGLPCPSPRDLPEPGVEPPCLSSLALSGRFFTTSATSVEFSMNSIWNYLWIQLRWYS